MQSFESTPTSPTKRLGVSLNVDTGYKGKGKEISPPITPKRENNRATRANIAVASRALRVQNGPRETFLDDITPVDPSYTRDHDPAQGHRDSHDLSLSQGQSTRDSLVDHMLLSLDQFSFGQDNDGFGRQPTVDEEQLYQTSFGDEESYLPNQNFAPRNDRGIGHNYSYSSDYEIADDASRYSGGQVSRSRRSNSSSNFQTSLGAANSKRKDCGPFGGSRGTTSQIPSRGIHSRSGKGSKGSSANSFDLGYAQVQGGQRWAHGLPGRSSSFDYGSDRNTMNIPSSPISRQMESNISTFDPYDYDAAPTPTVPGGPRRARPASPIMVSRPEPPLINPVPPKLERKRSTRSSKSGYKGKLSGNTGGRFDLKDRSRDLPPMPAFSKESAPAPLVGYGKSKEAPPPSPALVQVPKERPGFFRRVFGSSRNNAVTTEPQSSHGSTNSGETPDRPNTKPPHIGTQIKPPPAREPPPTPKEHAHVLTKKPSSFFRRRKKSVSEAGPAIPVPIVPAVDLPTTEVSVMERPLPSPVSSLRKVMIPYLRTPGRSPIEPQASVDIDPHVKDDLEQDRSARGFSPDYEPDPSATIRPVKHYDRESNLGSSYASAQQSFLASPTSPSGFDGARDERDPTFLADNSDNDREGLGREPEAKPTPGRHLRKGSGQTSILRPAQTETTFESPQSLTSAKSAAKSTPLGTRNEEWVKVTPTKPQKEVEKEDRVWLEPSSSEEDNAKPKLTLAPKRKPSLNRVSGSTDTVYQSATSLPTVQVEGEDVDREPGHIDPGIVTAAEATKPSEAESADAALNAAADESERRAAKNIYEGDEEVVSKDKAAAWLAEEDPTRVKVLAAYMDLYDFTNLNILAALRLLCGRLVLKAESQQVDRILVAFSKRWCECNSKHGFKGIDVVHTICYSLLLLNTDLHLADIDQKMTRSQFVKNAMPTIRKSVADCVPEAFDERRPSILPGKSSTFDVDQHKQDALKPQRSSIEIDRPSWRSSFKPPPRTTDSDKVLPTPLDYETPVDDCGPLVKSPFHGTMRTWEVQVEIVLKDFYNSIRNERLPLFAGAGEKPQLQAQSTNSLSVLTNGMLRRTPSVLSKAPSEAQSYNRGRTAETMRVGNGKWANKNRSRPRLYPGSGLGSSRTSLDDQSSMWSPSVSSSTWSKYSLGKTHTSMSVDSLGSSWPQGDYQQSIGFANALSQAIIREESVVSPGSNGSERDEMRVAPLLEDESLELHGAPWAKEGIVKHKHHLESLDKKAKDRNWNEVFAVIEKGYMSLFSFSSKSMRSKSKGKAAGGVVGGGNWQENAQSLGSFLLRQTIASALPSPGYSKTRPHVWALSLPTGAVHLFQVGTPDIIKEFVSSANYWSARLSNHPLVGGISNIEYGWSDAVVNNALVTAINNDSTGNSARPSTSGARSSVQSSLRSSIDQGFPDRRTRLPGDKISISDWSPPTQSMRASNLMEQDQLRTLTDYVSGIEEELQKHNQLRSPMLLAFTPRHPNAQKAMANWEKKSSYLLREIVKFRTYIDCLQAAEQGKLKIYAERAARKAEIEALTAADDDEGDTTLKA